MKRQMGVSMIELVIVLIIIILITYFSIYTGNSALNQATASEVYAEINAMREAVNSINLKKSLQDDFEIEQGVHYDVKIEDTLTKSEFEARFGETISDEDYQNTYIIYGMDMQEEYHASHVREFYGFDTIKHSYLVNFDEGKVDLLKSVNIADRTVRTFEQVRSLVDEGDI